MVDYNKLKVVDLKAELEKRGLAAKGLKAQLVAALQEDDAKNGGGEVRRGLAEGPQSPTRARRAARARAQPGLPSGSRGLGPGV